MRPRTYVGVALDEQAQRETAKFRDTIDPDLEWVEKEIRRCEDGPRRAPDTPAIMRIRNERLTRLNALRARLLGEEPSWE
jgi:hypothetical protein